MSAKSLPIPLDPQVFFLGSIPLLIGIELGFPKATLEINIHDTYFIIDQNLITRYSAVLFGITGCMYWGIQKTRKPLFKALSLLHVILSLGGILLILGANQLYREDLLAYRFNTYFNLALFLGVLFFALGQLLFLIQIIFAFTRKKLPEI